MRNSDWFKDVVVYQIYTRSFFDSNGDGIGDFPGVIAKLDYLKDLGIDVIWLSPFCESPNHDNGYDISDYRDIMKEFGTMGDFELLIEECNKRDIKVMMDLIMNHTSNEHPWFIESRSSIDNPKRDYYIWRKGRGENPPNNWESYFEDSAWTLDEKTGEYYLHHFFKSQPDLNWSNKEVREEMYSIIEWWLKKGIDGLRLDAIHHIGKPQGLPDALAPEKEWEKLNYRNTDETHEYIQEFHQRVLSRYNVMTVGETGGNTPESARLYVDSERNELNMIFHFGHIFMEKLDAPFVRDYYKTWYTSLRERGWDANFFSNHDLPRHISSLGDDNKYHRESAKAFATLILTLWGTPYIYQGEEIGMTNVCFESIDDYRDGACKKQYELAVKNGKDPDEAWKDFIKTNRDSARTPMQWSSEKNAGFTRGEPWIKVNPNYININVENEKRDGDSILNYYKKLIALRKSSSALKRGDFKLYGSHHPKIFAFNREDKNESFLVLLNLSDDMVEYRAENIEKGWELAIGNYNNQPQSLLEDNIFKPWEVRMYTYKK